MALQSARFVEPSKRERPRRRIEVPREDDVFRRVAYRLSQCLELALLSRRRIRPRQVRCDEAKARAVYVELADAGAEAWIGFLI